MIRAEYDLGVEYHAHTALSAAKPKEGETNVTSIKTHSHRT